MKSGIISHICMRTVSIISHRCTRPTRSGLCDLHPVRLTLGVFVTPHLMIFSSPSHIHLISLHRRDRSALRQEHSTNSKDVRHTPKLPHVRHILLLQSTNTTPATNHPPQHPNNPLPNLRLPQSPLRPRPLPTPPIRPPNPLAHLLPRPLPLPRHRILPLPPNLPPPLRLRPPLRPHLPPPPRPEPGRNLHLPFAYRALPGPA